MFFKSNYEGKGMFKYALFTILLQIGVLVGWIFLSVIPHGAEFLGILNESLNTQVWELMVLLKPIGQILLYLLGFSLIEIAVGFFIFWLAKQEVDNMW